MPGLQRLAWSGERQKRCSFKFFGMFTSRFSYFSYAHFLIQYNGAYSSLDLSFPQDLPADEREVWALLSILILNFSSNRRQFCFCLSFAAVDSEVTHLCFPRKHCFCQLRQGWSVDAFAWCASQPVLLEVCRSVQSPSFYCPSPVHSVALTCGK